MKKVLVFLQAGVGGAERMTVLFAKMLDKLKFQVKFYIVPKGKFSSSIKSFIPSDYAAAEVKESSPIQLIWKLNQIIKKEKPDIVFSSVFYLNNKLLIQRFLFPSVKFIVRCENYLYTFSKKQQLLLKLVYRNADKIIAQTEEMKDELIQKAKINSDKVVTMHNPIDREYIDKCIIAGQNPFPNNGRKHFLASGRFAYQKGFDLLVEAFDSVLKSRDGVDLYILGVKDGSAEREYERVWDIVKSKKIEKYVHPVGFQTNPYNYMRCADVFVLSSRWEGMPNVLLESLYLKTPVSSFKCIPIIERIVNEGVDGFLATPGDAKSLADAMTASLGIKEVSSKYRGVEKKDINELFENL